MSVVDRNALRRTANGTIYALGIAMSLLILYYAHSLYSIETLHAALVLGLSMGIHYVQTFRDFVAEGERSSGITASQEGVAENRASERREPGGTSGTVESTDHGAFTLPSEVVPPARISDRMRVAYGRLDVVYDRLHGYVSSALALVLPIFYAVSAFLSVATALYIVVEFERLLREAPVVGYSTLDYVVGVIVIFLITDVSRRAFGNLMGSVVVIGLAYGLFGPYVPGVFRHTGFTVYELIRVAAMGLGGAYGFILEIGTTWVAVFLLLAGFAKSYGMLDYFVELSQEVSKLTRSGIVHAAVVASLGFGSITGSGAANTATTGSFTIPMMKKQGIKGAYAGGIETVASIGGQLVPPIMGVAAFIMADLIGVPYLRIIKAGLIPAFLFYISIVIAVQIVVFKHGWTTRVSRDVDGSLFTEVVWYLIPFGVLIYLLAVLQYSPLMAGYYTVLSLIALACLKYVVEHGRSGPRTAVVKTAEGLKQGAVDMAALMAVLAAIGILIGVFTQTGFAQRLSTFMIGLSGESLLILLLIAMFVSLLFGLGMPAPAAYILTASLAAVAMVRLGVQDLTAHMFVFYFALYASFTPPVGPSTIIAAKLADATYIDTAKQSMRIAAPGFLIPYVFVANDSLIFWTYPDTILLLATTLVCITAISMSLFAYDGRNHLSRPVCAVYLGLAFVGLFGASIGLFETYFLQVAVGAVLLMALAVKYFAIIDGKVSPDTSPSK